MFNTIRKEIFIYSHSKEFQNKSLWEKECVTAMTDPCTMGKTKLHSLASCPLGNDEEVQSTLWE